MEPKSAAREKTLQPSRRLYRERMGSTGAKLIGIGVLAGFLSGLFGIGGGIVMVPLLVMACGSEQHRAHVNSLGAGIVLALAGSVTYALADSVDWGIAALLAAGAVLGAPIGARVMAHMSEGRLKIAFGILLVVMSGLLIAR
jgi:uncharacterized membrane protein YfcA